MARGAAPPLSASTWLSQLLAVHALLAPRLVEEHAARLPAAAPAAASAAASAPSAAGRRRRPAAAAACAPAQRPKAGGRRGELVRVGGGSAWQQPMTEGLGAAAGLVAATGLGASAAGLGRCGRGSGGAAALPWAGFDWKNSLKSRRASPPDARPGSPVGWWARLRRRRAPGVGLARLGGERALGRGRVARSPRAHSPTTPRSMRGKRARARRPHRSLARDCLAGGHWSG